VVSLSNHAFRGETGLLLTGVSRQERGSTGSPRTGFLLKALLLQQRKAIDIKPGAPASIS
jgi:hypothetical protein